MGGIKRRDIFCQQLCQRGQFLLNPLDDAARQLVTAVVVVMRAVLKGPVQIRAQRPVKSLAGGVQINQRDFLFLGHFAHRSGISFHRVHFQPSGTKLTNRTPSNRTNPL